RLLVAAQPTRGVDLRGIKELQQELVHARDDGTAIVLVSQELDELLTLSDRVLVMFHGTPAGIFDPTETDARARIGRAMLGQQSGAEVASGAHRRRPPRLPSSLPPHHRKPARAKKDVPVPPPSPSCAPSRRSSSR